jgi:deoxyuridine 5'-triphosphate nucleotidohydrolase
MDTYNNVYENLSRIIDSIGELKFINNDLSLILNFKDKQQTLQYFNNNIKDIPKDISNENLIFNFTNTIDLIGKLDKNLNIVKKLNNLLIGQELLPQCVVYKRDENAIIPHKTRMSDVGYDIYVIKPYKILNDKTTLYDTGIALQIPFGYYIEIVPRSSLSKTGYMLTNSIGIIDRSYRGNIYISLTKISSESIDIEKEYPFKCCQLILRKQHYMDIIHLEENKTQVFHMTNRNNGGFGSTNN